MKMIREIFFRKIYLQRYKYEQKPLTSNRSQIYIEDAKIYRFHVKEAILFTNILIFQVPKNGCHKERQVDPRGEIYGRVYKSLNRDFRNRSSFRIYREGDVSITTRKNVAPSTWKIGAFDQVTRNDLER